MKVLILNGSPRAKGNTRAMIDSFTAAHDQSPSEHKKSTISRPRQGG